MLWVYPIRSAREPVRRQTRDVRVRRLSARQVAAYLQGTKHVAFATVNERGEPRVAPLDGDTIGIVIHGHATIIGRNDADVEEIEPVWRELYGSSPFDWGDGVVFMRVEPSSMWAYAQQPENFPDR